MLHEPAQRFKPSKAIADQSTCRVAELAVRFSTAERQWRLLDGAPDAEDAGTTNELMMDALTNAACFDQATSATGALFQICIVSDMANNLSDMVDENEKVHAKKEIIRLESALWSVRRYLEAHFGISASQIGGDYMMEESTSYLGKLAKVCAPEVQLQAAE